MHAVKKNKEPLVVSTEISLRLNADKTKYVVMSHEDNAGKNHNTDR
jgi:hypothetical protein